jgi:putrescine aminotransferase
VCAAAAIAAIHVTLDERLPEQAAEKGRYVLEGLRRIAERYDGVFQEVRGLGLLLAMEFYDAEVGYKIAAGLFRRGVLVAGTLTNAKTIRIEPALTIPYAQLDTVLERLEATAKEVSARPAGVS